MKVGTRDEQLETRLDALRQLINRYALAKRNRVYLEQYRKVKKAQLMRVAESNGFSSVNAQEREAYSHSEYIEVINGLAEATEVEAEAWWLLQMEEWKFEAWRTRMASERAEKSRYGVG
jgi:hypothetical protein